MPFADLPGVHLWYNDTGGSGAPVVFLHAFTGNTQSWQYQLPAFVAAGYRCITYDRRGWGRTQTDPSGEQPGYITDDLQGLVEHLRLDRFHLVGTAGGGYGGLDYALKYPARLLCLVVACSGGGIQDPEYFEVRKRLQPPNFRELPAEFRELGPSYRAVEPEGTRRWLEIEHASRQEPGVEQRMRNHMTLSLLETIRVPTLMIAGDADLLAPPSRMRLLAARVPNCQFATVPEAGHSAFWEQPEIWNRIVLDFLGRH